MAAQCMTYPVPLNQRVEKSDYICTGRVTAQTPYIAPNGNVQTLNTVEISAWLKGHLQKTEIGVITLGGVLGDRATLVEPSLQVDLGGEYLFFLQKENPKASQQSIKKAQADLLQLLPYAENQGVLTYQFGFYNDLHYPGKQNEAAVFAQISGMTRQPVLKPDGSPAEPRQPDGEQRLLPITGFSPSTTNAGTIVPGDFITITGSGFGASPGTVFFTNADDGGATFTASGVATDNVSWSDNSITVKVARRAGTGPINVNGAMTSASNLTVNYAHLDINSSFSGWGAATRQRYYHRNLNGSGGYSFKYNNSLPTAGTSMDANAAAKAAFERAVTSWACSTGINWKTDGATATGVSGVDGVNVVLFDNTLAAGILGQAVSNFSGSASAGCNLANTVWWVTDIDLRFRPDPPVAGFPWEYGPAAPSSSEYDFESVAVHELGHAHGLGHRIASGEVMNFAIANGQSVRTPSATEIAGGTARVTYSQAATCYNPTGSGTPMLPLGALAITCPANVTVTEPYSLASFTGSATTSGGCGMVTVTQSPVAGTSIPVGNQIVTLTATDGDGATATCTFTVTVNANCPATGTVWYVNPSAASGGNGASWACGFQNLQDAIDAASSGHEIWVKTGTYLPTKDPFGNASPTDPRDKTFYLKDGVALYGGFDGSETMLSERDWVANPTILSGDIGTLNDSTDNCYHVVLSVSDANTTVLDGFTVTRGNAGAFGGTITVETKTIARNHGGGLHMNSSALTVSNCAFVSNRARNGGGAYNEGGSPNFSNCNFTLNHAKDSGGTSTNGGGIYSQAATLTLTNCVFSSNTSGYGGGIFNNGTCTMTLTGCSFLNNYTGTGGGIFNNPGTSNTVNQIMDRCIFSGNTAWFYGGGGVYNDAGTCTGTATNCLFSGNKANSFGGVRHNSGTYAYTNCVFSGNWNNGADSNPTIWGPSSVTFKNSVFWNNRSGSVTGSVASSIGSSAATFSYCLAQAAMPSGTGNLNGIPNAAASNYPSFVTPLDPATAPSTAGDFHINSCSPVLNLGDNTGAPATDLFGNARPFGTTVDLGVHELQSASAVPTTANAGPNQNVSVNSATMAANTPVIGTGAWSLVSGSGTITNAASPSTTITNLGTGANVFRWTISNAPCSPSASDVTVTYSTPPVILICPTPTTVAACQTQAAVDNAFSTWLATASASGGCDGMLSNNNTGAPPACGGSTTVTFTYTSSCPPLMTTCQATFTVPAPASPAPTFSNCSNNTVSLGCNPANLPSCTAIASGGFGGAVTASNSCGSVPVTCTAGGITISGCTRTQIFTFEATACGQTVTCTRTFTWNVTTPPSFNGTCGNGVVNLGCNPVSLPACDPNVTASNQCGPLTVTCNVGTITVNGCNRQQSFLYVANAPGCGNFSTCQRIFNWQETTAPVFGNCDNTIDLGYNPATLPTCANVQTTPFGGAVTATNECGNVSGITCSAGSVSVNGCDRSQVFTFTITGCGFTTTCTRTFTWQQGTAPSLTCPPTQTVTANSNCQSILADYTASVTSSGGCGGLTFSQSPTVGTILSLGNQTVTITATDDNGSTGNCTLTVTVADQTAPTITCPANTTVAANASCQAVLTSYTGAANASDNCGTPTKTQSPASGTTLSLGNQTVTITATDGAGNTANCTLTVTVADQTAPTISCPANTTVTADNSGNYTLANFTSSANASDNCGTPTKTQSPAAGTVLGIGSQTVTITATDAAGNSANCTFSVTVQAGCAPPTVNCPANTTVAANANCQATLANYTGSATVFGGCGTVDLTQSPATGTTLSLGNQTVTITATDDNGSTATCAFTVSVLDTLAPSITCPADATVAADANCQAILADYTGSTSANDNCTASPSLSQSPTVGTALGLGNQMVTMIATDEVGNFSLCQFELTVADQTPPTVTCPADATVTADNSGNYTLADFTGAANASDNCTVSPTLAQFPALGTVLGLGNQTITITATDDAGLTANCQFDLTVQAGCAPPTVDCPANVTVAANTNCQAALADYTPDATVFGGCGTVDLTQSPATGTTLSLGNQTVTITATDDNGSTANCTLTVTVADQTAPTITCP
ncbi:MAG: HYR domain-containing protein, partial [Saprospiraceae bacterium]